MADLREALITTRDFLNKTIDGLVPVEPPPPRPAERTLLKDEIELRAALKRDGYYQLDKRAYVGNFIIEAGVDIAGPREAILAPLDQLEPTIWGLAPNAKLSGFTAVNGAPDRECIVIGRYEATDVNQQPFSVTLDGLAVTAGAKGGHRGIALHGKNLVARNCEITNFWEVGRDSQGIWIHNGPGPYEITGNLIEASGENILFGGDDPNIQGCVPSDVLISGNWLRKPDSYSLNRISNKNCFEIKNGRRVMFSDNKIDNLVLKLIQASLIQLTPRNQSGGAPWCCVEDVSIYRNIVNSVAPGFAVNILGTDDEFPSGSTKNVDIRGNLFRTTAGFQILSGVEGFLQFAHNTLPDIKTKLFSFDRLAGKPDQVTQLVFIENVARSGTYAITGDGSQTFGLPSLTAFCQIVNWDGNIIERNGAWTWPEGQLLVPSGALKTLLDPVTFKLLNGVAGY